MSDGDRAAEWSGTAYAVEASHHRTFDDWFLDRCPPEPNDVVVDLGCGSGEFTTRLSELAFEGRVVGVEPDPSMLEAARRHERPNLEFVSAAAEDLDRVLPHGSVDLVVSRAMLHWLPLTAYPTVFAAVWRVLKPGGRFHSESGGAGNVAMVLRLLRELADQHGLPAPEGFPDAGTVFDLVEQAGFDLAQGGVQTVVQRRSFTSEQLAGFLRTQAAVALTRAAPPATADAITSATVADLDRLRRADGTYDQTFVRLEILARRPSG